MHAMTAELPHRYPSATRMLHDLEEFRKEPNIVFDFTAEADGIDVQRLINDPNYMPKTLGEHERGQGRAGRRRRRRSSSSRTRRPSRTPPAAAAASR